MKPSLLITSMGSGAAEGIMECLGPVRDRVRVVGTNTVPEALFLYETDAAYLVPSTARQPEFLARMREIIAAERPALVFNGRDEEVVALSQLAAEAGSGCRFLGPPPQLAPLFNDKYLTAGFARTHELPFADTACAADELQDLIDRHGLPLVAKPRRGGHANRQVFLISTAAQAAAALARGGFAFQPYIGARGSSTPSGPDTLADWRGDIGVPFGWSKRNLYHRIDLVIGFDGSTVAACVSRADCDGSLVKRLTLLDDPALNALAERHARALAGAGHCGPVDIQGVLQDDGSFLAFEWNARFVGSSPGYALLGANQVVAALRHGVPALADLALPSAPAHTLFRPHQFRPVADADIATLRRDGRWQRAG